MIILSADGVRQALPMPEVIVAVRQAYAALSAGRAEVPLRSRLPVPPHEAVSLFMPVFMEDEQGQALCVKVVSLFPHNSQRGLPLIQAAVLVLEPETGRPLALLEGSALTAVRTGAASGAATALLARPESRVAAIFGAGVQGRTQLAAVCSVRPIETAWVYDLDQQRVERFIAELAGKDGMPPELRQAASPAEALAGADVVCTATTSLTPVFRDEDLKPGTHLNGVGSYTPDMQEIPPETVKRATVFVDSRSAALSEAGDLIQPLRAGLFDENHIQAELGEIVLGSQPGRTDPQQITFFKSVGVAVQDAAAARLALHNAEKQGLGQTTQW
jgi:ornithine cyclodeaminase/alanine dehydrogenase-like protein (mu-crystallin family)